jgi:hypothetical protein
MTVMLPHSIAITRNIGGRAVNRQGYGFKSYRGANLPFFKSVGTSQNIRSLGEIDTMQATILFENLLSGDVEDSWRAPTTL